MTIRIKSTHISTSVSISLVLFLMGITALLLLNAGHFGDRLRENINVSIILHSDARQAEVLKFRKWLDVAPYVSSTRYVSREEAAQRMQDELGEDFVGLLGENPLPNTIEFKLPLAFSHPDSILSIEKRLQNDPLVKAVYYPKAIVGSIDRNIRRIGFVLLFFALLLMLITVGLINNWVRIAIYSDRFLIRTQELVGATSYFISRPYIGQAVVQGVAGGIFAMAMLTVFVWMVQSRTDGLLTIQYMLAVYVLLLLVGAIFSGVAAFFAVRRFLNTKLDTLYA